MENASAMTPAQSSDQQASGRSIFWAITAIVLNAMLQASYVGHVVLGLTSGSTSETSVWPWRSSPAVCIVDAVVDWRLLTRSANWRSTTRTQTNDRNTTGAIMRIAMFVLGVLPQAIKLFSMRGILPTQALAAVFLIASCISMIRSFRKNAVMELKEFVEARRASIERVGDNPDLTIYWYAHIAFLSGVWYWIAGRAHVHIREDVRSNVTDLSVWVAFATQVYMMQHVLFTVVGMKPPIPRYPSIIVVMWTDMLGVPGLLSAPSTRSDKWKRMLLGLSLLLWLACTCYLLAYLVWAGARRVFGAERMPATTVHEMTSVINDELDEVLMDHVEEQVANGYGPDGIDSQEVDHEASGLSPESEDDGRQNHRTQEGANEVVSNADRDEDIQETPSDRASSSNDGSRLGILGTIALGICFAVILPIMTLLLWAGVWNPGFDEDSGQEAHISQQSEIEAARPSFEIRQWRQMAEDIWQRLTWGQILYIAQRPFQLAVRVTLKTLWRGYLGLMGLLVYSWNWYQHKVQSNPIDIAAIAFVMVNIATLALVYLCFFDGNGTTSPQWNSILG